MQDEVNKIVFNALADGREVWLPGVGLLAPDFRSALRTSGRCLERPVRRIVFLSEQRGVSLVDLIAEAGACDAALAEDIYSRWLERVRTDDGIVIAGVGTLHHRYFNLDERFDALLNPLGHEPLTLRRRRSKIPVWVAVVLLCTTAAGYGIWYSGRSERAVPGGVETVGFAETLPVVASKTSEESVPDRTRIVVPADTVSRTEVSVSAETSSGAPAPETDSGAVEESRTTTEQVPGNGTAKDTSLVAADTAGSQDEVRRMTPGRTYVVRGVYSTEENALRAAAEVRAKVPSAAVRIYRFGEKWMISVFESDSAEECRAYVNRAGAEMRGVWPYTRKR